MEVEMLFEARPGDCPIKEGLMVGRYLWGFLGPTVGEVGTIVRCGGGWVAPVKFTSGECALLRCYLGDGAVSIIHVVEWKSNSCNAQGLLSRSARLPEVVGGRDPGVLYLRVFDLERASTKDVIEAEYELRLKGILGHTGENDEVAPLMRDAAILDAE